MERELIRIPVDDVAPESIPTLPLPAADFVTISPREYDRLTVFKNIVDKVLDARHDERVLGKAQHVGPVTSTGKVSESWFCLDEQFRDRWNQQASIIYEQEILPNPDLKEVADDIVAGLKEQYDGPPALTPGECYDLFSR